MSNHDRNFLKNLLAIASPSGFENDAAELWKKEAKLITDVVSGDIHGNSMAALQGKYDRIMLAGHIDEIGLMINYIDENGFLYFKPIGGWDSQVLPGQRVKIYTKKGKVVKGVVGRMPMHLMRGTPLLEKAVKIEDLWIDTGRGKNIKTLISVGDYAVIDYGPEFRGDILMSRGLDDKIGAFVVLKVLEKIKALSSAPLRNSVCAVATVQEEIGLRGAITSAYNFNPRIGIAVDVTFASDHPKSDKRKTGDIKLGFGPVISIGPNITPVISNKLIEIAKLHNIPYQIEAAPGPTGTDANVIQLSRGGVATGLVSIPNRYMHSPCEMIDLKDVENAILLLAQFCLFY